MNLQDILSVSGLPGLHRLLTTRSNGLIIEDLDTGKRRFITLRKYQFTPLESVGIYTYMDVESLQDIFQAMNERKDQIPPEKAQAQEIMDFFREIVPEFDEDRVHLSDIKKVLKWYAFLDGKGLLAGADEEE